MSDFDLSVGVVGIDQAVQQLGQLGGATRTVGQQVESAGTAAGRASSATENFGQGAQQVAARVQGLAGQVASLAGRLGGGAIGQAAGLVSSLAGVTAQAAAMGATLGPGGVVFGAISGLVPLVAELVGADERVATATDSATAAQHSFSIATTASVSAINDFIRASQQMAQIEAQRSRIDQGLGTVDEQYAAAELAGRRLGDLRARDVELRRQAAELDRTDWRNAEQLADIERQRSEIRSQMTEAQRESTRLGALAVQAEEDERDIQTDILTIATDAAHQADVEAHARERSAAAAHSQADAMRAQRELENLMLHGSGEGLGDVMSIARSITDAAGQRDDQARADARQREQADIEKRTRLEEQATERTRALAEEQRHLADAAKEASDAFSHGSVNSLDQVIQAFHHANDEIKGAGGQIMGTGRLLERGMVAVGNNISEMIGGTMTSAFNTALGAWLDGSKSFVQAAEEMAKGIIKSLTQQAIVQAVVETARGLADLAQAIASNSTQSQYYASATSHFAAAAAFGAVGAIAGGVGAAVGAFGGGSAGAGGHAGSTRDMANASSEAQRNQGAGGTMVLNVYPGGYITQRDVQAGILDALDRAARDGMRINPRLLGGATVQR